ncbi:Alpha-glucan water dikinase, chloroplastic [Sesamum alatum]|uniref:Alpha-glucan water dikinase, chloroplastic n=1 Tax=Sesamum alatum TaxID=300844 RepID=A0AAE1YNI7_9LAMI|nr:Alpha-glucan water dikinase, chloroplastic [Sesamum alatum]
MEARDNQPKDRLKDLLFLDIALDSTVRATVERGYEELSNASPEKILYFISLVVENLALSVDSNEDLICCLKVKVNFVVLSPDGSTVSTVETRLPKEGIDNLVSLKFWACGSQNKHFSLSTVILLNHTGLLF